jgi:hypothetical protein
MDQDTKQVPISLKSLRFKTNILTAIVISLIAIVLTIVVLKVYESYNKPNISNDVMVISTQDVDVAYAPELKRIIFLDKKTGQVKFSLSDSISMVVFSLKKYSDDLNYNEQFTNKHSPEAKK